MSFCIRGCRITLHYYFFAMAAAMVIMCHDGLFLCGIAAAAVHELGHIAAMIFYPDTRVKHIEVHALGVRMTADGSTDRPVIILAGVAANCLLALTALPFMFYGQHHSAAASLIGANLCLALCNILPIEPLDGGSLLRYIAERHISPEHSENAIFAVSLCAMLPLFAAGLFAVMQSRGNFSLLILCLWLLAGILRRHI